MLLFSNYYRHHRHQMYRLFLLSTIALQAVLNLILSSFILDGCVSRQTCLKFTMVSLCVMALS